MRRAKAGQQRGKQGKGKGRRRRGGDSEDDDSDDDFGSTRARKRKTNNTSRGNDWEGMKEGSLKSMRKALDVDMTVLYRMGVADERYVNLYLNTAYLMMETKHAEAVNTVVASIIVKALNVMPSAETQVGRSFLPWICAWPAWH